METLRQRNRRMAMRTAQRTALPMFVERGFEDVSVAEIAEAVGMAPSTLYRHFATKEDIVLWDEHDAAIDAALGNALRTMTPLHAIRSVLVDELGSRYDDDLDFQLERIRYIYDTEELHGAAVEADLRDRDELSRALSKVLSEPHRRAAPLLAGAAMLAVDVALDRWQADRARTPLREQLIEAFDELAHLDQLR